MLSWLLRRLPVQDIGDGKGNVFFHRYTLLKSRWFALYLHGFERSDHDRCLHDHPWPFLTLVLRGGYWEHTPKRGIRLKDWQEVIPLACPMPTERTWRGPLSLLYRPAKFAHRIELQQGRPKTWSLVLVGRKARPWGFYTVHGWMPWTPKFNPICETD